ncbi:MAG: hypothetical protein CL472_01870 [Acidobacteria bacterium]|nr:hypothetical protein [Acidobacteriota bacterium]|tara:strand:+ start:260 stop:499 length:240 start_codon:yes stop_codon:yes gene_type:complete
MTKRKAYIRIAAGVAAYIAALVFLANLGLADSIILTGFVLVALSLIALDIKLPKKFELYPYAALFASTAIMLAPIFFIQ